MAGSGRNLPRGTEENHEETNQDNRSSDQDLYPGHSEYEAEVLTIRPRRSVGLQYLTLG